VIAGLLRRFGIGKQASRGSRTSGGTGNAGADRDLFFIALCEIVPDFDRYARAAGDAAEDAVPHVFATLPPTGRGGRSAVVRRYLSKRAAESDDDEDQALIERLSEKQLALVARRARVPI